MENQSYDEDALRQRRRRRSIEARRKKRRQRMIRKLIRLASVPILVLLIIIFTSNIIKGIRQNSWESAEPQTVKTPGFSTYTKEIADNNDAEIEIPAKTAGTEMPAGAEGIETPADTAAVRGAGADTLPPQNYTVQSTEKTQQIGDEVISNYALILEAETGNILAQRNAATRINPASMTKILTILVAAENVNDLDDTFTITREMTDYSYVNDLSNAGFEENEKVTVRDLFYGTILPSGGDAAAGLAIYTAGSLEAFVDMMNEKLTELGLSDTAYFTNCAGIYDTNHYCTIEDIAIILKAALDNELCKEVLSAHTYTTSATAQHPEGIIISNWFLRRIEDKDAGGEVLCGKTGYVLQSGSCAASYGVDKEGKGYICVTADANSGWRCIYDHVDLYKKFLM